MHRHVHAWCSLDHRHRGGAIRPDHTQLRQTQRYTSSDTVSVHVLFHHVMCERSACCMMCGVHVACGARVFVCVIVCRSR